MPNTRVPAAGEAMPAAEVMPTIGRFSRRALLGAFASVPAIGAATAAFATVATSPKVFPNFGRVPAAPAEHPDTALFALDREMEEANARMEQASKVQDEVYRRCTELYPPEPPKWEDPIMSDHLREFIRRHPLAEGRERAEYHKARAEKRAAWQASQEAYLEQVEAIDREGGLYPADEAYDARVQELWDIGDRIFATPANTLEGMAIKLRAADRMGMQGLTDANKPFLSIAADIRRLAAGGVS